MTPAQTVLCLGILLIWAICAAADLSASSQARRRERMVRRAMGEE